MLVFYCKIVLEACKNLKNSASGGRSQQEVQTQYTIDLQNRAEGANFFWNFDFKLKAPPLF